jgi:hypothetical protein
MKRKAKRIEAALFAAKPYATALPTTSATSPAGPKPEISTAFVQSLYAVPSFAETL